MKAIVRGASGTPGLVESVRDAVGEQRLHPGPAGEDLDRADTARRRVAVARGGDVGADLADDAPQCAEPEHQSVGAEEGQGHVALAAVGGDRDDPLARHLRARRELERGMERGAGGDPDQQALALGGRRARGASASRRRRR